ncbi:unnamed protein product [Ilex paraguariensis]|uniref:Uncharacterized protein n=1 Tax=Ilex paraguariensis TaxID=185542 RepID=A0ABC8RJ87_9AQUA
MRKWIDRDFDDDLSLTLFLVDVFGCGFVIYSRDWCSDSLVEFFIVGDDVTVCGTTSLLKKGGVWL